MTSRRRVLVLLFLLAGCGSDQLTAPEPEPRLVLGTGELEFAPIDGEPRASLVAGAQGGFHVWAAFLVYGFDSTDLELLLATSVEGDPDSRVVLRGHLMLHETLDATGEPALSFAGFPAQVYDARCAQGKRVRLDASVSDPRGAVAQDTRYVIADIEAMRRSDNCR